MATWVRDKALLTMTCALGTDGLIPIALTAEEHISQTFSFEVEAVSQKGIIDPDSLLYHPACVTLQVSGEPARYFNGIVRDVTAAGSVRSADASDEYRLYRLTLVPSLWFLNQTTDCRIYQNVSVVAVLQKLLTDAGITGTTFPPPGETRDYIAQFNETDLHFATRLMEEEGYFYFFEHTAGSHPLIIANQNSAFKDIPNAKLYLGGGDDDAEPLESFDKSTRTVRGQMKLKDYDPTKPDTLLQNQQPTTLKTGGAPKRDDFRWPALTFVPDKVTERAKHEMEAAEAVASMCEGTCQFAGLVAGGKFNITSKPASSYDGSYVVHGTTHRASDDTWLNSASQPGYFVRFTAFQASVPWRDHMRTPRPRMDGIYTGIVLGPPGEEIYTDEYARVKVQFFWDHRQEASADQAVWARVIQPWAGNGWGTQFIPRVGTEVAVAFVDGDPDRPIVVGGLYNGQQKPIYSLSDKTKSGIRTRSSLKGGTTDFNEYTFDDKKGGELIYEQAQKDLTTYVKNNQTLRIDNCRIVTVKKDETVDIQNNQTIKVKQDHTMTVTDGNHSVAINKGNMAVKVAMGNLSTDVQLGNVSLNADAGAISNQAMQSIELTVGQSSIKIDPTGVTISGLMISIQGQTQTQIQGLMTQINADAMLALKGAITMIN